MAVRNTLDVDTTDKKMFERIRNFILRCKWCCEAYWRYSASLNGFHFKFICKKNCCLCRIIFDDPKRLDMDTKYFEVSRQNVLWTKKYYRKGRFRIFLKSGDWIRFK